MLNLLLIIVFCLPALSYADKLITIYDSGDTLPIDRYAHRSPPPTASMKPLADPVFPVTFPVSFPIATPGMRPGKVEPVAFALPHLQTPLFLIGSDTFSRQWLVQRRAELQQLGAIGLLVEVKDKDSLTVITKLAEGLRLVPAPATVIVQQLGLRHYPVLISKTGWEQ